MKAQSPQLQAAIEKLAKPSQYERHGLNLFAAYEIMFAVPKSKINLRFYRYIADSWAIGYSVNDSQMKNDRRVRGCTAGWISAFDYFRSQGLRYSTQADTLTLDHFNLGFDSNFKTMSLKLFGVPYIFDGGSSDFLGKRQALYRIRKGLRDQRFITRKEFFRMGLRENMLLLFGVTV